MPQHEHKTGFASLRVLLVIGIAAACGPRVVDDEEPTLRRCTFIVGTGVTVDGERRRTDYDQDRTHMLCTCSTWEEAADFSPGGYREYINELALDMCLDLVEQSEILDDDCQEHYEHEVFTLTYGHGPSGSLSDPVPCDEDEAAGCHR